MSHTLSILVAVCAAVIIATMASSADANICTYRACSCASKECTTFTGCTSYTQSESTCGTGNKVCNCTAGVITAYLTSNCTGIPTATYSNGGCYNKATCYFIDSCVQESPSPSPSASASPTASVSPIPYISACPI